VQGSVAARGFDEPEMNTQEIKRLKREYSLRVQEMKRARKAMIEDYRLARPDVLERHYKRCEEAVKEIEREIIEASAEGT